MQQRSQNQIPVKREEILHGDGDNGVGTGATSASVYPMTPTPPPRGLEPMLPLSPPSSPSSGHSYVPPNSDHYAIHSVDTSSRMSLQSILHPSSEDQVSKSLLTTPLIRPSAGLNALTSTPFVQILSSPEPRYPAASFDITQLSVGHTSNNGNTGIKLPRLIASPMLASISKAKPSASNLTPPFPPTPSPVITNLHDALAEVDRLRERCRASFEYIEILERANESLRIKRGFRLRPESLD